MPGGRSYTTNSARSLNSLQRLRIRQRISVLHLAVEDHPARREFNDHAGDRTRHVGDPANLEALANALCPNTKMIWDETPTKPMLEVVDLARFGAFARECGLILVVNTTPSARPCCNDRSSTARAP